MLQKHTLRKLKETEGGNKAYCRSIHLGSWRDRGREQGIMQKHTLRKLEETDGENKACCRSIHLGSWKRQREGTRHTAEAYT